MALADAVGKDNTKEFKKLLRALIEDVFVNDEFTSKDVMTLYRISKDMSHASGYNFNATASMVDALSQKVMIYAYQFILHFLLNASRTLEEHGVQTDIKPLVDTLKDLQSMNIEALDKIYKAHMKFDPKILFS